MCGGHADPGIDHAGRFRGGKPAARLQVKDYGTGIHERDLPYLFDRFYKADKARTRGRSGTGLGLAIVKNIVEAHQGSIHAHSKAGTGTHFTFYIPKKKQELV